MLPLIGWLCCSLMRMLSTIYSIFRVILIIIQNIYCISAYMIICNLLLLPIYFLSIDTYSAIENVLYNWLLYIVSSWSWCCGLVVYEHGDDIYRLREDPNTRILVMSNHQSTADVPLVMQSFSSRSRYSLLWIMDTLFKWTHFGIVSSTHGDYFIDAKRYRSNSIHSHAASRYSKLKDAFILFPEGGFRYKREASSNSFAVKKNLPKLANVVYPRYTGFKELLEADICVTHIVDLTICYDKRTETPWIWDIIRGNGSASEVHFYYKIFPVSGTPGIRSEEWLQRRWQVKERILARHYRMVENDNANITHNGDAAFSVIDIASLKTDNNFVNNNPSQDGNHFAYFSTDNDDDDDDGQIFRKSNGKPVELVWKKLFFMNLFYFAVFCIIVQVFWIAFKHI